MNVHTAASIDNSSLHDAGYGQLPAVFPFRCTPVLGNSFPPCRRCHRWKLLPPDPVGTMDAGVVNKTPCFPLVVGDLPWVVGAGGTGMDSVGSKQAATASAACWRVSPVISISQPKNWSFRSIDSVHLPMGGEASRFPMASTTLTVTPLPACLYSCASD